MEFLARGLTKALKGRILYEDLDLELRPGHKLVVRGASGAGKSQLLRHLAGLDAPRAGEVSEQGLLTLDGRSFEQWGGVAWRREVAYVPQQVPRLLGTPAEFSARLAGLKAQRETRGDGGARLARDFGLEAGHWQQPWFELSVGERQRAMLAIFVAREPAVILLDEPTAALDPDSTQAVEDALRDQALVWVTHNEEQERRISGKVIHLGAVSNGD